MPDTSDFDVTTPRGPAPRRGNLVAALLLGLLLVGGFIALWVAYHSAPPQQPQADVAANASNETAQVIRDLQTAIKGLQTTDEKGCWPASIRPTNTRIEPGGDKATIRPSYRVERQT